VGSGDIGKVEGIETYRFKGMRSHLVVKGSANLRQPVRVCGVHPDASKYSDSHLGEIQALVFCSWFMVHGSWFMVHR